MSIAPDIVPPARGNLVAILLVIVVEKFASSLIAAANSFRVSNAAGAVSTRLATAVSTSVFRAASFGFTGADKFWIVAVVPPSIFNVPEIVTLLNVEVPEEVTSPATFPETEPVIVPDALILVKEDVPEDAVTLPDTLPLRSPVNPLFAVIVVPVIPVGFVDPITTPFIEPLLPAPPTVTEPRVEVVELREARVLRPVTPRVPPTRALPARCRSLYFKELLPMSIVLVVSGTIFNPSLATTCLHCAALLVLSTQINILSVLTFIQTEPTA
tara:strand:+ start:298 stop:1107 length:810 start_codon:yes stop_codon:yes gene_type:complete